MAAFNVFHTQFVWMGRRVSLIKYVAQELVWYQAPLLFALRATPTRSAYDAVVPALAYAVAVQPNPYKIGRWRPTNAHGLVLVGLVGVLVETFHASSGAHAPAVHDDDLVDRICAARGGDSCAWIQDPDIKCDALFIKDQLAQAVANGSVVVFAGGDTVEVCHRISRVAGYAWATEAIAESKPPPSACAIALVHDRRIVLGTVDEMIAQLYDMAEEMDARGVYEVD